MSSATLKDSRYAWIAAALLVVMGLLMIKPLCEETATRDEGLYLAAGYCDWHDIALRVNPEDPPHGMRVATLPLLWLDTRVSERSQAVIDGRFHFEWARPWLGLPRPIQDVYPQGRDSWYFWPWQEGEVLGSSFLYDGVNDAERLLRAGRLVSVALSLMAGAVIYLWTRKQGDARTALLAVAMWAFNPIALACGHLVILDMEMTLMMLVAVWMFVRFLQHPKVSSALWAGLATGGALATKYTAMLLVPMFAALALVWWAMRRAEARPARELVRLLPAFVITLWATLLVLYMPDWSPAPPLAAELAQKAGVPRWFQVLRPILIPADYFKGLAMKMGHAAVGHDTYLCGEWRMTGWWYYFPVAIAVKTPIPLLILIGAGAVLTIRRWREVSFERAAPWAAAAVYLGFAITSNVNLGVRHLLPVYALLAVGVATQFHAQPRALRVAAWVLCIWLAIVAVWTHPFYIEYHEWPLITATATIGYGLMNPWG